MANLDRDNSQPIVVRVAFGSDYYVQLGDDMNAPVYDVARALRPVRNLGTAAIVLVWVTTAALIPLVVAVSGFARVAAQSANDQTYDPVQVTDAANSFLLSTGLLSLVSLISGIVFWVWSWRARVNAELLGGPRSQELSRGWTFWGWICPIVSLWFPCQIMLDIYRTSSGGQGSRAVVIAWWVVGLCAGVVPEIVGGRFTQNTSPAKVSQAITVIAIISVAAAAASAVLISVVINRISAWQQAVSQAQAGA